MSKNSTRGRTLILETANTQARAQLFATYPDGWAQVLGALLVNYMVCRQAVSLLFHSFASSGYLPACFFGIHMALQMLRVDDLCRFYA